MTGLSDLPDSILVLVLGQLSVPELCGPVTATCTRMATLVQQLVTGTQRSTWRDRQERVVAVFNGSWRCPLYLAALERSNAAETHPVTNVRTPLPAPSLLVPARIDFSSFCLPDGRTTASTATLVSDGHRVALLDAAWGVLHGHIPPQYQNSPHRPAGHEAPSPVPVSSVPDFAALQLLLLQPAMHGAAHVAQARAVPQLYGPFSAWPPEGSAVTGGQRLPRGLRHVLLTPECATVAAPGGAFPGRPSGSGAGLPTGDGPQPPAQSTQNGSGFAAEAPIRALSSTAPPEGQRLAVLLPRSPVLTGLAERHSKAHKARVAVPGSRQLYSPAEYNTQTDLAFQLLCKALALPTPVTALDMSHHTELRDSDIALVLSKVCRSLTHLSARCTQTGPTSLLMLGSQDRLNLESLDLSYSLHTCCSAVAPTATSASSPAHTPGSSQLLGSSGAAARGLRQPADNSGAGSGTGRGVGTLGDDMSALALSSASATHATAHASGSLPPGTHSANGAGVRHGGSGDATGSSTSSGSQEGGEPRQRRGSSDAYAAMLMTGRPAGRSPPPTGLISGAVVVGAGLRHRHPSQLHAPSIPGLLAAPSAALQPPYTAQPPPPSHPATSLPSRRSREAAHAPGSEATGLRSRASSQRADSEPPLALGLPSPVVKTAKLQGEGATPGGTAAVTGVPAYNRLLRSALGRLTALTELRVAGNDLSGLFEHTPARRPTPSAPISPRSPSQAPHAPHASTDTAVCATLARLRVLDISHCAGLHLPALYALLRACTQLDELVADGCLCLAQTSTSGGSGEEGGTSRDGATGSGGGRRHRPHSVHQHSHAGSLEQHTAQPPTPVASSAPQAALHAPHDGSQPPPCVGSEQVQHVDGAQEDGHVPRWPALRRLTAGWGFSGQFLETMGRAAGERLTSLRLGVGAGVCNASLAAIASTCPALQELRLQMAAVSDEGVRAVLTCCPHLHVLHLEQCVGPFTPALLLTRLSAHPHPDSPSTCADSNGAGGNHELRASDGSSNTAARHRWTLSSLMLCGPPVMLNDQQLKTLIGKRRNTLRAVALSNCPLVTPAILTFLTQHHSRSLQHLRLESCCGGGGAAGGGSDAGVGSAGGAPPASVLGAAPGGTSQTIAGSSGAAGGSAGASAATASVATLVPRTRPVWRLTETSLLSSLAACTDLRSLTLRHCCQLSAGFVEALTATCPLLSTLTLDTCDLAGQGVRLAQQPYAALQQIQVVRCRSVESALAPQLHGTATAATSECTCERTRGAGSTATGVCSACVAAQSVEEALLQRFTRKVESDILVHDLLEGRTSVLPIA